MNDDYIKYWGLTNHPFLLAPDGRMMCVTGQYFECFERLKYAINTNKGGIIIASEDPGLGKTTILLRLIDEMKNEYGENFKCAFIDHPTLTASQMIEQITADITGETPSEDKLKNLNVLKEVLTRVKQEGGRSIIIIDEAQMLCDARDILQEMRILINLVHRGEYLHTFILSGQKALWDTLQEIPEFWQRLPVRYYFTPLLFKESRELIRHRLNMAGLDVARDIFTDEALEIIHKHSQGLPRTIIAISDLALLNGFIDRTRKVGFKEVTKAINAMGGKGEGFSYVLDDHKNNPGEENLKISAETRQVLSQTPAKPYEIIARNVRNSLANESSRAYTKAGFVMAAAILLVFLGAMGQRFFTPAKTIAGTPAPVAKETIKPQPVPEPAKETEEQDTAQVSGTEASKEKVTDVSSEGTPQKQTLADAVRAQKDIIADYKEELKSRPERSAIVNKDSVNVRTGPGLDSPRILTIVKGEILHVVEERRDKEGMKWYKVLLYNDRVGWISDTVVVLTKTN